MSEIEKLRDEVLAFQRQQFNLQLWKLVSIGAVASVALGVTGKTNTNFWIFAILPLVSIYVDLILRQLDIRIIIIATFIRKRHEGLLAEYEKAIVTNDFNNIGAWKFNEIIGGATTLAVSFIVFIIGIQREVYEAVGVCLAASTGIVGTLVLENSYRTKRGEIGKNEFNGRA